MNPLGYWTPETDEQRAQRYFAEQIALANAAQNNIGLFVARWAPPAEPRFRSIDPAQKLSPKAARLLAANHWLVQS